MVYSPGVARRLLNASLPLWLAGAVALLSRWGSARELVPALGLLTGPLAGVLLGLGLAVGLARLVELRWPPASPTLLFAASFAVAAVLGVHNVSRLPPSGDEIRYLVVAQSLWRDGDIDLRNNLERGDYREYVPELRRQIGIRGRKGPLLPLHRPGLPALVAPAYAAAGRKGCAVLLAALLAALGLAVRRLALRATGDERAALWAWAAAVGPPAFFYSAFLYPEVPAALAIALALLALVPDAGAWRSAGAALAASCLPWLHPRLALCAAALGVVAVATLRGRARLVFVLTAAAMAGGYLAFNQVVYGAWAPLRAYRGTLGRVAPEQALFGLLLDPAFGLLVYAPIFLLALSGLPALASRRDAWRLVLPLLLAALLGPVASFGHWYGGFSAPARLVTSCVPLLALLIALRASEAGAVGRGLARWSPALLALGYALLIFSMAEPERKLHVQGRNSEARAWLALSGEVPLSRYLPRLAMPVDAAAATPDAPPDEKRVAAVWAAVLLVLLVLDRVAVRNDRVNRAFGSLALPLGLFLLLSLAVDGWARRGGYAPLSAPALEDEEASSDTG